MAAHHSLVLRTSSLLDCQFLHQFFCLLYFRATSRSRLTPQGRVSTGIDGSYFISLIYFTLVCSFLLTSSERVSFSYFLFACEGKRECWLLVALPLALNVADCSPHQLAGLAALLRLLPGLARRYPGKQAAAVFWKFELSKVVVEPLGQVCLIVLFPTFETLLMASNFPASLTAMISVTLSLLKQPTLAWRYLADGF